MEYLESRPHSLQTEQGRKDFNNAMDWIKMFPASADFRLKAVLIKGICKAFKVTELELIQHTEGHSIFHQAGVEVPNGDDMLERVLPRTGWFANYAEYTRYNEAPLSYHIFSSMCILGAACGRKVWKSMGTVKSVYPNYCVILIGPTGIKKNTAADTADWFIRQKDLCPVFADKITPEALISSMQDQGGHHFLYAPEAAVFFGKQKYNDGLSTIMLRLLDCPDTFENRTQTRGVETVTDVALTVLAGTTPSLIMDASASEVSSSGFLNRFMLVVEDRDSTRRCFPEPRKGVGEQSIMDDIQRMKEKVGEVTWSKHGADAWDTWYRKRWSYLRNEADDITAEVLQRSFNHVLRTTMLMHLVLHDDFEMCDSCLEHSIKLIEYTDRNVPSVMSKLRNSKTSADMDLVVEKIDRAGGAIGHSDLVRAVSHKMQALTLKMHIKTLEEAGRVKVGNQGGLTYYALIKDKIDAA